MGLNYSFRFYLSKTNIEKALLSLATLGDKESREYLLGAMPYVPAAEITFLSNQSEFSRLSLGVKGLELGRSPYTNNRYCLSLVFLTDSETLKVAVQSTQFSKDKVRVGCIYLSVTVG